MGLEATGEWATSDHPDVPDVLLAAVSAVVDHESLDRIDYPRSGLDATVRWELGQSDLEAGSRYSLFTAQGRLYTPLGPWATVDIGGFLGSGGGSGLPLHRRFYLGGTHPSAVFDRTQATFHGLSSRELQGSVAQVVRAGLRLDAPENVHLRFGAEIGGVADQWRLPIADRVTGWSVALGYASLVGPVTLEWSTATARSDRWSIGVGRRF